MRFVHKLLNPSCYPHSVDNIELLETHISWVLLTGQYAYKLKKPVDLGFLDYSDLEKRKYYCEQELRLNRRLAPQLYLSVETITLEDNGQLRVNGKGTISDYAVKMLQFDQTQQLDRVLAAGKLSHDHIQVLATDLARFHNNTAIAGANSNFGSFESIQQPVQENFDQLTTLLETNMQADLNFLQNWSRQQLQGLKPVFQNRKKNGFVRECHGDMHLRNIALIEDVIVFFDCIEFNDELRWIDTMSEVAFIVMDLYDRNRPDLAHLLLNTYLEAGGDYEGIRVLRFYLVYRAMVRAKVESIRAHQSQISPEEKSTALNECRRYLGIAMTFCKPKTPLLIICHGLSGSGKTTVSGQLLQNIEAIRIRSDIERKRLAGLNAKQSSHSNINTGIYSREMTIKTYHRLFDLAKLTASNRWNVIVDAAFLKQNERQSYLLLAQQLDIPFIILDFHATAEILRQRIKQRQSKRNDASEATVDVLEKQIQSQEQLNDIELINTIRVDAGYNALDLAGRVREFAIAAVN